MATIDPSARAAAADDDRPDPLEAYRPVAGSADELIDPAGAVRPVWRSFLNAYQRFSAEQLNQRFARGDQCLRDAGVFYRQYEGGSSSERAWPLSHVPVLLHEDEWRTIGQGLIQRANLLEAVVADLYGAGRLVSDGHLPASLIATSPEWLRPMVGVHPQSGHYLHFLAFEIGRGPDGSWWVLGDRTQAPSGAGFALENRIATSRVFPELFVQANVRRLAGFFRAFRDALEGLREESDSRVAILTPGRHNDAYFEHAYIARYLGFMLLEGEDLTVERGRVMVRTVAGLSPISVLWRRLDAAYADPLELNSTSRLGTPGLVSAIRQNGMSMVNALGVGVLEIRALAAFLPRLSKVLLGEALAMPNLATWWCGQPAEQAHVRANADKMLIGPALTTALPFDAKGDAGLTHMSEDDLNSRLSAEGALLVGQEAVKLSTTPACIDGALVPRPMALRLFLARTPDGWQVMPGGYARIGRSEDSSAITLQGGGSVADVWVVGDQPVPPETMLGSTATPFRRAKQGALPSRAADNLFWLGRYVERAETAMRLIRAYHVRLSETADPDAALVSALADHLELYGIDVLEPLPSKLQATLQSAIHCAGHVRERFSVDGWVALTELSASAASMAKSLAPGDDAARAMSALLRQNNGFAGLVHDNMYRFSGWRFLSCGRALERAAATATLLIRFADRAAPEGALDLAIEVGDSVMTHRRRYNVATNRATVVDLLALDARNPRAILFQLGELREHIEYLQGGHASDQLSPLEKAILRGHTDLAVQTPESLDTAALVRSQTDIAALSELLTATYLG